MMKDQTFGNIRIGDPNRLDFAVDWDSVEKAKKDLQDSIDLETARRIDQSSGLQPVQPMNRLTKLALAGAGIGFGTGVAYAFHKKTGFWKGWGLGLVGAVTMASLFRGVGFLTQKD